MSQHVSRLHQTAVVTDKNVGDKMAEFNFDEDLNGNNGDDFTCEEALERGFTSTMEMIFADADKKTKRKKGEKKVVAYAEAVLDGIMTHDGHYEGSVVDVVKTGKNKFVVILNTVCTT
jgi:hypothetical protein